MLLATRPLGIEGDLDLEVSKPWLHLGSEEDLDLVIFGYFG